MSLFINYHHQPVGVYTGRLKRGVLGAGQGKKGSIILYRGTYLNWTYISVPRV